MKRLDPNAERPRLRRSLGQHHLRDGRLCRPLVDHLRLSAGDRVIEIGPGGGVLTRELLATGASVAALELDREWAFELRRRLGDEADLQSPVSGASSRTRLSIVVVDALTLDWTALDPAVRVAGNLPYNVGTVVVERLLRGARVGLRAGFLLQREVVDRAVAKSGDESYGALSLLVAMRARAERLGVVRPGAFFPPPKVDSAFLGLETVAPPVPEDEMPGLEVLVRAAFSQRRKTLRNALSGAFGRDATARGLKRVGLEESCRGEELTLDQFVRLHHALALDR